MANSYNFRFEDDVRGSTHPYSNNSQIACRLCNQVFMTNQTLIAHIDSHMVLEGTELRRLSPFQLMNSHRGLFPNPNRYQTSSSMSILMPTAGQEDMICSDSRTATWPPLPPPDEVTPLTTMNQFSSASRVPPLQPLHQPIAFAEMNDVAIRPPLTAPEFHRWRMEESESDKTKPYIMLIDQPIKKIEIIDLDCIDDSMDLTLKL